MRDDNWLQQVLDKIWDNYFSDVPQENDVRILFGRRARRRLGSISLDPSDHSISIITINGYFRSSEVPEFVIEATIVHELTHYAHGFNSPLTQSKEHPHAGGVMRREFSSRGLEELYMTQRAWLKENWQNFVTAKSRPVRVTRKSVSTRVTVPKPFWFMGD